MLNAIERGVAVCGEFSPEHIALGWGNVNFDMHKLAAEGAYVDGEAKASGRSEASLRTTDLRAST